MQAISRMGHEKFCKLVQSIKITQPLKDDDTLIRQERELEIIFNKYRQKLIDIKGLIIEYEVRKKAIRLQIKKLHRERKENLFRKIVY